MVLTMYKVLVLAICLLATTVYSCKNGYVGEGCGFRDMTIVDTKACTISCMKVLPNQRKCRNKCPTFEGPICTADQQRFYNNCDCTIICVDMLSESQKCNQSKTTMCNGNMYCVDGVCKEFDV